MVIMGCWIFVFFIVVILITTQNIIVGAILTILSSIFFLLFSADNKKQLSQIRTIQTFRLKDIHNIYEGIQEEMRTHAILLSGVHL